LTLDKNGWANVEDVLNGLEAKGKKVDFVILKKAVEENNKKRFSLNGTGDKIRANQGHSVIVDVELKGVDPPEILYHGTVEKYLDLIKRNGLNSMTRQHVHLSHETATAENVGRRRGCPLILKVSAQKMAADGYKFFLSENGVWLTDHVPAKYVHT
jgi:putative RNA 2'-phosphotransferase|tara:strand:+ start:2567 stop:3034 length:468 start_codon:yes stop_codon:yes gene_type:complete